MTVKKIIREFSLWWAKNDQKTFIVIATEMIGWLSQKQDSSFKVRRCLEGKSVFR
jgi:hypothetical protein